MIETHPFGDFVPNQVKYLLLGSFVTKPSRPYTWFYANGRDQFWPIMEEVYNLKLDTLEAQQKLFVNLQMALADIILSCQRKNNSNLDINLFNIVYNIQGITTIVEDNNIKKIFFTSKFVEKLFRRNFKTLIEKFPTIELVTLPSPSPRYAMLTKQKKIEIYKGLLP